MEPDHRCAEAVTIRDCAMERLSKKVLKTDTTQKIVLPEPGGDSDFEELVDVTEEGDIYQRRTLTTKLHQLRKMGNLQGQI